MLQTQKIKIQEKPLKNVIFSFEGQEIEIIPHIDSSMQETLIGVYLNGYFQGTKESRFDAEIVNKIAVLDLLTNVDIENVPEGRESMFKFLDGIEESGLWEKITKAIKNYRSYEYNLSIAIESKKKENTDIGYLVKKMLEEKVYPLIEKFQNFDMSDEKLAEVKGIVADLGNQLKDTPAGNLIKNGVV